MLLSAGVNTKSRSGRAAHVLSLKQHLHTPQVLIRLRVGSIVGNASLSFPVLEEFFLFFRSLSHSPTHRHSISNQTTHPPTPCLRVRCCKQATKTCLFT